MKKLKNKVTGLTKPAQKGEGTVKMSYADLIDICVSVTPERGFTLQEQKARFRILDITENVKEGKELAFEDADYNIVLSSVNEMKWAVLHRDIVAFGEAINNCK